MLGQEPSLDDCLQRGNNNFDLLRLVAALSVIFGHGFALSPAPSGFDPIGWLLGFEYAGSLSVKLFFFLSGLLVCHSIRRDPRVPAFLLKRVLRIFPALIVCNVVTIVVGVAVTSLPAGTFLTHPETWRYFVYNSLLLDDLRWHLPGVFTASKYGVNGSIWTLPKEWDCYLFVACLCAFGAVRVRFIAAACFAGLMLVAVVWPVANINFIGDQLRYLPFCFGLGALGALFSEKIKIKVEIAAMLWVLLWLVIGRTAQQLIFYVAFFYSAMVVATQPFVVRRLRVPYDASYGIYIYGFLIQQTLFDRLPRMSYPLQIVTAMILAIIAGTISWFLIEEPAMRFGKRFTARRSRAVTPTIAERELANTPAQPAV